ncbi:MAG: Rrf2 family transcriptional regulator [Sedimentisphaerales bacterium]|nr:Rrf2 family transcriptional regulator [Sedimentisphaerales bacterium]
MNLSMSTGYGMIAAAHVAKNSKDGPVLASTIAKEYGIPTEYLLKIMQQLVRAQILRSKRGPRGGFTMAKPAKDITMLEIIEAVNGPLRGHLEMSEQTNKAPFSIKMEDVCYKAAEQAGKILARAKLSDML